MTRAQWKAKYREWRVQHRVWKEMLHAGTWTREQGCPPFATWWADRDMYYRPTRLLGDTLAMFGLRGYGPALARGAHRVRMNHLCRRVRLPA